MPVASDAIVHPKYWPSLALWNQCRRLIHTRSPISMSQRTFGEPTSAGPLSSSPQSTTPQQHLLPSHTNFLSCASFSSGGNGGACIEVGSGKVEEWTALVVKGASPMANSRDASRLCCTTSSEAAELGMSMEPRLAVMACVIAPTANPCTFAPAGGEECCVES